MGLQNQREEYSVLDKKGMYLIKYEKILCWVPRNCEELLKILQEKVCVTKKIAVCCIKYDFHSRKVLQQKKDVWWVEETVKIGFDLQKNIWIRIKKFWKDVIWSDETKMYLFGSDGNTRVWRKVNWWNN